MNERKRATHWVGENNNTLHGNGAGSKDMERTSGDEGEVTCSLCQSLLIRMRADRDEYAEPAMTPTQHPEPTEVAGLTEDEREALAEWLHGYTCYEKYAHYNGVNKCETAAAHVESHWFRDVLAGRLAAVQAERDEAVEFKESHHTQWMLTARDCESAEAEREAARREADDLRARLGAVETLASVNALHPAIWRTETVDFGGYSSRDALAAAHAVAIHLRAALANPSANDPTPESEDA